MVHLKFSFFLLNQHRSKNFFNNNTVFILPSLEVIPQRSWWNYMQHLVLKCCMKLQFVQWCNLLGFLIGLLRIVRFVKIFSSDNLVTELLGYESNNQDNICSRYVVD